MDLIGEEDRLREISMIYKFFFMYYIFLFT
jgi:hypothetical protein